MRLRLGIVAMAALLAAGLAAGATPRPAVLGVIWEGNGLLARLDARTLRPVGRKLDIGTPPVGLVARSPDGRTIALGHGTGAELRLIDLRTMRAAGRIRLATLGSVQAAIWPSPGRLVALLGGARTEFVVVDVRARRVLLRQQLDGELSGATSSGRRLLALLAPRAAIGQARLAMVAEDGIVRTVALPLSAGFAPAQTPEGVGRQASPGIAIDPGGRRAAVVGDETLVTVDLETLDVTSLKHVRRPARATKRLEGWGRRAVWLPDDRIAITGWNMTAVNPQAPSSPAGVTLFDLASRTSRELDRGASVIELAGTTLLVSGGSALRGFGPDGTLRFELLGGADTGYLQTSGRWAYVASENSTRFTVVDTRAGTVAGTARTPYPTIVLG